jgi:CubicO group peptidase (beta-lactamase class C family)
VRRLLGLAAIAVALVACGGGDRPAAVEETSRWALASPADEGLDPERLAELDRYVKAELPELTSLLVARHGRLVFERYYNGWGASDRFAVWSVTKSIVSALVGIAIREGKLKSVDQRLVDLVGDVPKGADPELRKITLRDLLTMRAGFTLEDDPRPDVGGVKYTGEPNWVRSLLGRDVTTAPGTRFTYDNGVTHLVSAVLTKVTGMPAAFYARDRLFRPLGIEEGGFWEPDPQGNTHGAYGLQLHARDLAKLGELYLHQGRWGDERIVPAAYVRRSTRRSVRLDQGEGYGYFWWTPDAPGAAPRSFAALGYGGQAIVVTPTLDLVVVTTAQGDEWPWDVWGLLYGFVVPAVED